MEDSKVIQLVEKVEKLTAQMEMFMPTAQTEIKEHNTRLRNLESFRDRFMGALTLAGGLGGFVGGIITIIISFLFRRS